MLRVPRAWLKSRPRRGGRGRNIFVAMVIALLPAALAPRIALAAPTWTTQSTGQSGTTQTSVSCPTSSVCYSAGGGGKIIKTTNGGASWVLQTSGIATNSYAMSCGDTTHCALVRQGASVQMTADGGATSWVAKPTGSSASYFYGVWCPAALTCYVVGQSGHISKTTDAGATWTAQNTGIAQDLNNVYCIDTSNCWTVGRSNGTRGVMFGTTNGGTTWTAQTSMLGNVMVNGIHCSTTLNCVSVGNAGTVQTTTNGGSTWTAQSPINAAVDLNDVKCWDATHCEIVGYKSPTGAIYSTTDGTTWNADTIPATNNLGMYAVVMAPVAAGGYEFWTTGLSGTMWTATLAGPSVTGLSPTGGPAAGGTSVVITGTNFTGATAVNFGGTAATGFTVNSATQVTATSPAGSGVVDVTVTTPNGGASPTNANDQFTYTSAVLSISPPGATTVGSSIAPGSTVSNVALGSLGYTNTLNDSLSWSVTVAATDFYNSPSKFVPFTNCSIGVGQTVTPSGPTPGAAGPVALSGTDTTPGTTLSNAVSLVSGTGTQNGTYSQPGDTITVLFPANLINSGTLSATLQYTITG